jgi:hypothetical protein
VSSDSTRLSVVNLECNLRSHLHSFNVEEAVHPLVPNKRILLLYLLDVMRGGMNDRKDQHGVSDLSVKPLRFVERYPSSLWSKPTEDISAHGHDDDHCINTQNQTGTSRNPD